MARTARVRVFRGDGPPTPSTLRPGNISVDPTAGRLWIGNEVDPCDEVHEIGGIIVSVDLDEGDSATTYPTSVYDLEEGDST